MYNQQQSFSLNGKVKKKKVLKILHKPIDWDVGFEHKAIPSNYSGYETLTGLSNSETDNSICTNLCYGKNSQILANT